MRAASAACSGCVISCCDEADRRMITGDTPVSEAGPAPTLLWAMKLLHVLLALQVHCAALIGPWAPTEMLLRSPVDVGSEEAVYKTDLVDEE